MGLCDLYEPDFYARFCIALGLESLLTDPRFEHAPWAVPANTSPS